MQSLLDKVKDVEVEAVKVIEAAQEQGSKSLATVSANEQQVLAETKARAEQRAQAIVTEQVSATKEEVNKVKQEREQSLKAIAASADENRAQALAYAAKKFEDLYEV